MPLTMRITSDLLRVSVRNSFLTSVPYAGTPTLFPSGAEHWLPWGPTDLLPHVYNESRRLNGDRDVMSFEEYFTTIFGNRHTKPSVLCFAQGAQFAVSKHALESVPYATYETLRRLIDEVCDLLSSHRLSHRLLPFFLTVSHLHSLVRRSVLRWSTISSSLGRCSSAHTAPMTLPRRARMQKASSSSRIAGGGARGGCRAPTTTRTISIHLHHPSSTLRPRRQASRRRRWYPLPYRQVGPSKITR